MASNDQKLALHGGTPAVTDQLPAWPPPDESVRDALLAAFEHGAWGQYHGPHGKQLAEKLSTMHGLDHVLLCSSGTVAVELALRGVGVVAGDEVILAAYDFPGNFRAVEAIGATPVLVDIEPDTWCLDADELFNAIGPNTKAILVSHLHGGFARMCRIRELADAHGIAVVEDACQVPGARVEGRPAGGWGDASVLSFGGSKLLTAGRGGAMITRHHEVLQRAKIFSERGNLAFPLSELQAAVLLPQLDRLEERNAQRQESVNLLLSRTNGLQGLSRAGEGKDKQPENLAQGKKAEAQPKRESSELPDPENQRVYYKLAWRFEQEHFHPVNREDFLAAAEAEGLPIGSGFRGFTRRSQRRCRKVGNLEHSERAAEQTVLLHHTALLAPPATVHQVANALEKVCAGLKRCATA